MKIKEDSAPDRIRKPAKIGPSDTSDTSLGGGLDEAGEAQLGVTDEELEAEEAEEEADLVKTPPEED